MAARKLATEVDRTFKRITEGVELFEAIYDKMMATTNQAQKEKLETDLKTQIKKLQRMRDQIKVWLQSNDIKDKQQLTDYRKLIETQMEKFKACEKEMKTKAFSRAGLDAAAKLDPKEVAKRETADWVGTTVDDLSRQIETAEAEIESLTGVTKKKKDNKGNERIAELEAANDRRKWHISRLEIVLRMLENGTLDAEKLTASSFQDDVRYYVESNNEEDFEEDEGIYDDLNLDEEEELFGMNQDDVVSSHDSTSVADTSDLAPPKAPAKEPPSGPKRAVSGSSAADEAPAVKKPVRKATLDGATPRPILPAAATKPATSAATGPVPVTKPAQTAPLRYASAAAGALAPPTSTAAPGGSAIPATPSTTAPTAVSPVTTAASAVKDVKSPPALTPLQPTASSAFSASPSSVISPPLPNGSTATSATSSMPPPGFGVPSPSMSTSSVPSGAVPQSAVSPASPTEPTGLPSPPQLVPQQTHQSMSTPTPSIQAALPSVPSLTPGPRPSSTQPSETSSATKAPAPSSLADLVSTFEGAKSKAMRRDADLGQIHQILESSFNNLPQAQDADKPKYYVPRMPFATPSYYPTMPLPHLETPALFSKLDLDTLFYVFYYFQGTYMQYLAAQELKKQSWRFHKQYLTWFQRANEPSVITDEYEQGVYLYFDWESAWSTRRKNSFQFHYVHLSDA